MSEIGNSNRISREYIDSLRIETRYMDSTNPDTAFTLYGERFASPIMTAALSHLDHFMFPGAAEALARGAKAADALLWYGMAPDEEIDALSATGARMIEIIKPYADREKIYRKIRHAEALGLVAVGIDNPAPSFEVRDIEATVKQNGNVMGLVTCEPVNVDGKCNRVYRIPMQAQLAEGVGLMQLLATYKAFNPEEFTIDLHARANVAGKIGKDIDYKDVPLTKFMKK